MGVLRRPARWPFGRLPSRSGGVANAVFRQIERQLRDFVGFRGILRDDMAMALVVAPAVCQVASELFRGDRCPPENRRFCPRCQAIGCGRSRNCRA